ncbi:MAG: hypothetical protein KAJ58_00600 [Candidatus Pacebacteria bacterium]|nr:hypothetical protein [Candidatus Paceibacterota bacterium]
MNFLKIKKNAGILFLVGIFFIAGALTLNAWTGPSAAPPYDTPAPLNVSATAQTKTGNLYFPKWFDGDTGYYVDPSGTSKFNEIDLGGEKRTTWPEGGGGVAAEVDTLDSVTDRNNTTSNSIKVASMIDSNHNSYYINPYGFSVINVLKSNYLYMKKTPSTSVKSSKTNWVDIASPKLNITSCYASYSKTCSGYNSMIFPAGKAGDSYNKYPTICYGKWSMNTGTGQSSCDTGWIWSANCDKPDGYLGTTFSNCPMAGGNAPY